MGDYPEHDKLQALEGKNQAVGDFMEWLQDEKKVQFSVFAEVCIYCDSLADAEGDCECRENHFHAGEIPFHFCLTDLLAEFFEIDQKQLCVEKDAMYRELQGDEEVKE